jgi:Chaperone of endosialidase
MTNFKKNAAVLFFVFFSLAAFSQVKIVTNGKSKLGNEWPYNDYNNEVTHEFFGLNSSSYRPGCKISLGDYGASANGGANVFIAEAYNWDSDQLEVHGKNGIFLTIGGGSTGHGGGVVGAELNSYGDLSVKGIIRSQGVTVSSDIRLKSNIKNLNGSLASISKLQGLSYDFKPFGEDSILLQLNVMKGKEDKDTRDIEKMKKLYDKKKLENLNQIGFSAQDIQKIFPQLVKEDEKGYLAVNYTALIPVLVEGVKEQQAIIEAQRLEIDAMKKDLAKIKAKLGM